MRSIWIPALIRNRALAWTLLIVTSTGWFSLPASAEDFDVRSEVKIAVDTIEGVHGTLGGMGGLGAIPEPDLQAIQGLLGEAEKLVREARRRAQNIQNDQDSLWAVSFARAGRAMAETVNEYRKEKGYQ